MEKIFKSKAENIIEVIASLEEVHTNGCIIDMLDRVTDSMFMIKNIGERLLIEIIVYVPQPDLIMGKSERKMIKKIKINIIRYMNSSYNELYKLLVFYVKRYRYCKTIEDFQYMFLYILKRILRVEYTIPKQLYEVEYAVSRLIIINPINDILQLLQDIFMYRELLLYTISVLKNSRYK